MILQGSLALVPEGSILTDLEHRLLPHSLKLYIVAFPDRNLRLTSTGDRRLTLHLIAHHGY